MGDSISGKSCLTPAMDGAGKRRLGNDLLENKLMKKFLLGTVALIALGATAPALAADMAARPYTKAPAYSAPIYNWTGFYIGGHVGGAFAGDNSLVGNNGRFLGVLQGGFDYQFASSWVVGVEAQYSWLGSNNTGVVFPGGVLVTSNNDQLGSVTGRIGYTWGSAPASNTCSRRAGPPRSNTSITTSAAPRLRRARPSLWERASGKTSIR